MLLVKMGRLQAGLGWGSLSRSPALLPQLVMRCWEPVPRGPVLWAARAEPWATWVPLLCFVLHAVSWLLVFSILLVFDYAELMGLKQVRPRPHLPSFHPLASPRTSRSSSHARAPSSRFRLPCLPHLYDRLPSAPAQRPETSWACGRFLAGR